MPEPLNLFISYRSSDAPKVDKIARDLALLKRDDGTPRYAPWQDKHHLPPASPHWWDAIVDAIDDCPAFVFHISLESLKSAVCQAELEYAHRRNRAIIPIVLEGEYVLNDVSGKYDLPQVTWKHVPAWLGERQFLFYTGADFYRQFEMAMDVFRRNWPRPIPASRPLTPDLKDGATNHTRYDQACDFAERLAFVEAEALFRALVQRNDPHYAGIAAEWLELLALYTELMDVASRPRAARARFKPLWDIYLALFPKPFWEGLFDPQAFAEKIAVPRVEPPVSPASPPAPMSLTAVVYFKRATELYFEKQYDRAIADYSEAIRRDPQYIYAYYNRGLSYYAKNDYDRAIADYSEAARLDPQYADVYDSRGRSYYAKGDYDRAITDYDRALEIDPKHYFAADNLKKALEAKARGAQAAMSSAPKGITAQEYYAQAEELREQKRYDEAIANYTEAIRLNPQFVDAYFYRGGSYLVKKEYDHAIADFTEAIRLSPRYAIAYYWRGQSHFNSKEYDRAIADYDNVLSIEPNHPLVGSQRDKALKERAASTPPASADSRIAEAYFAQAHEHWVQGRYNEAIAKYTEVIRYGPQFVYVYYWRGLCYEKMKDYNRAIDDYTEAIRHNPQEADVYIGRGHSYASKGDYDRAIADYDSALKINPKYPNAVKNRQHALMAKKLQG